MRIACIGDLHGVDRWKEALELEVDHYVFVGDYVDSYDVTDDMILTNLVEVVEFKTNHPEEVTLLLGNHDIQYLFYPKYKCTGFRLTLLPALRQQFTEHANLFQTACCFDNYLFTHAGLCRGWMQRHMEDIIGTQQVVDVLNHWLRIEEGQEKLAEVGPARGGIAPRSGPFWCDFEYELRPDPQPGFHQIVGHTRTNFLIREEVAGSQLFNVNYLAYSAEPIFVLEI